MDRRAADPTLPTHERRLNAGRRPTRADFFRAGFQLDWPRLLASLSDPLLILGNPPWVTQAARGRGRRRHLPP